MSYAKEIENLIARVKKESNSLQRNKVVSHLEDALAHAYRMRQPEPLPEPPPEAPGGYTPTNASLCTCPSYAGVVAKDCPIHNQ